MTKKTKSKIYVALSIIVATVTIIINLTNFSIIPTSIHDNFKAGFNLAVILITFAAAYWFNQDN